jgi:hypothetical protein
MVLKRLFAPIMCVAVLALNGAAVADEPRVDTYQPDQFLVLDLSKAVLSPKLLGPSAQFTAFPVEANTGAERVPVVTEPKTASRIASPRMKTARAAGSKVRAAARTLAARGKLALSHSNPLDAQASDTRVQVWPCKSGGICNWQR